MIHKTAMVKGHFLLRNVLGDQRTFLSLYSALKHGEWKTEQGERWNTKTKLEGLVYPLLLPQPSSHTVNTELTES